MQAGSERCGASFSLALRKSGLPHAAQDSRTELPDLAAQDDSAQILRIKTSKKTRPTNTYSKQCPNPQDKLRSNATLGEENGD